MASFLICVIKLVQVLSNLGVATELIRNELRFTVTSLIKHLRLPECDAGEEMLVNSDHLR